MPAPVRLEPGTVKVQWFLKPERIQQVKAEAALTGRAQSQIVDEALEGYFGKVTPKSIRSVPHPIVCSQR